MPVGCMPASQADEGSQGVVVPTDLDRLQEREIRYGGSHKLCDEFAQLRTRTADYRLESRSGCGYCARLALPILCTSHGARGDVRDNNWG